MDALLKKHFWIVNLLAIAVLAWLVATGINGYLATKFFAVPQAKAHSASAALSDDGSFGRVPEDWGAAQHLRERRVFNLDAVLDDVPDPAEAAGADEAKEAEGGEEEKPSGSLAETKLPINLFGTMVDPTGVSSMATMSVSGDNKLAWLGDEFLEGKAKVVQIHPRYIVLKEEEAFTVAKLWTDKAPAPPLRGRGAGARPTKANARGGAKGEAAAKPGRPQAKSSKSGRPDYAKGVRKTGPYEYEVDKKMVDEQLADLSKVGKEARVVPNYKGGKYDGFKLVGVRPGSLYRTIGIRSGDIIKAVNGSAIDSPNKALDLFEKFKSHTNPCIDIERRGQKKQFCYAISPW